MKIIKKATEVKLKLGSGESVMTSQSLTEAFLTKKQTSKCSMEQIESFRELYF